MLRLISWQEKHARNFMAQNPWKEAREIVLLHVSDGLDTVQKICHATGFNSYQVSHALQQLKKKKLVGTSDRTWWVKI